MDEVDIDAKTDVLIRIAEDTETHREKKATGVKGKD